MRLQCQIYSKSHRTPSYSCHSGRLENGRFAPPATPPIGIASPSPASVAIELPRGRSITKQVRAGKFPKNQKTYTLSFTSHACRRTKYFIINKKLADASDLKSAGRKAVGVQVPLWAPIRIPQNKRLAGLGARTRNSPRQTRRTPSLI